MKTICLASTSFQAFCIDSYLKIQASIGKGSLSNPKCDELHTLPVGVTEEQQPPVLFPLKDACGKKHSQGNSVQGRVQAEKIELCLQLPEYAKAFGDNKAAFSESLWTSPFWKSHIAFTIEYLDYKTFPKSTKKQPAVSWEILQGHMQSQSVDSCYDCVWDLAVVAFSTPPPPPMSQPCMGPA